MTPKWNIADLMNTLVTQLQAHWIDVAVPVWGLCALYTLLRIFNHFHRGILEVNAEAERYGRAENRRLGRSS